MISVSGGGDGHSEEDEVLQSRVAVEDEARAFRVCAPTRLSVLLPLHDFLYHRPANNQHLSFGTSNLDHLADGASLRYKTPECRDQRLANPRRKANTSRLYVTTPPSIIILHQI
jgi:hypothetical protein